MANDKITERIYIKGKLELVSPLVIGSGQDEHTDIDLIRDWNGKPFIPGTAIAGAVRHYLEERLDHKLILMVFGNKEKDSTQSLISFYDAVLPIDHLPKIKTRDGVRLKYAIKTADDQAKYDYEILEPGQKFEFRADVILRENHASNADRIKDLLYQMLDSLNKKKISFGAKTRRGFGRVTLSEGNVLCLNMSKPEDIQKWINFKWEDFQGSSDWSILTRNLLQTSEPVTAQLTAEFEICYSILIRHYSESFDADTVQLTSDGKSVIPATSWNGAIRHAIYHILKQLNKSDRFEKLTNELFGFVDEANQKAKASRVVIRESVIHGGQDLTYTRNKVDRFTGGVVNSALFDEMPHYGGKVEIDISIIQPKPYEIGLIYLALEDIGNGIQPVGGDASIGRGILRILTKPAICIQYDKNKEVCLKELAAELQEQP